MRRPSATPEGVLWDALYELLASPATRNSLLINVREPIYARMPRPWRCARARWDRGDLPTNSGLRVVGTNRGANSTHGAHCGRASTFRVVNSLVLPCNSSVLASCARRAAPKRTTVLGGPGTYLTIRIGVGAIWFTMSCALCMVYGCYDTFVRVSTLGE